MIHLGLSSGFIPTSSTRRKPHLRDVMGEFFRCSQQVGVGVPACGNIMLSTEKQSSDEVAVALSLDGRIAVLYRISSTTLTVYLYVSEATVENDAAYGS